MRVLLVGPARARDALRAQLLDSSLDIAGEFASADEARQSSRLAHRLLADGTPLPEVIASVQRKYPYDLNGQRTLTEALGGLPPAWQRAEIEEVAERRALGLWAPTRDLLIAYDRVLSELRPGDGHKARPSPA